MIHLFHWVPLAVSFSHNYYRRSLQHLLSNHAINLRITNIQSQIRKKAISNTEKLWVEGSWERDSYLFGT